MKWNSRFRVNALLVFLFWLPAASVQAVVITTGCADASVCNTLLMSGGGFADVPAGARWSSMRWRQRHQRPASLSS
jgi:hypothetical protein